MLYFKVHNYFNPRGAMEACQTSDLKVAGSSPAGDDKINMYLFYLLFLTICYFYWKIYKIMFVSRNYSPLSFVIIIITIIIKKKD